VREAYAAAARAATESAWCCGPSSCCGEAPFGASLYGAETAELPQEALAASLGCGNPTAVAKLRQGETVLDLGSGGGIDVLLAARRVGPTGFVYGLDMTDKMLTLARRNAKTAGATNVDVLRGEIEAIPLPKASVEVVISHCAIDLSVDKPRVFREIARVLRPGGRVGVTDVVAEDRLSSADRAARGSYASCIAGALSVSEYQRGLHEAGLNEVSIAFTHQVADGLHAAIVKARKPICRRPRDSRSRRGASRAPAGQALEEAAHRAAWGT